MAQGLRAPSPEFHEPFPEHLLGKFDNPYSQLRATLAARQKALEEAETPPMFSPQEAAQRKTQYDKDRMYSEMGLLSRDPAIGGIAKPMLAEAIRAAQKKQTDHGEFDPITGEFREFPSYTRQRKVDQLTRELATASSKEAEAQARWDDRVRQERFNWENRRQSAAEAWMRDRENEPLKLTLKAMGNALGDSQKGSYTPAGTDPVTGEPVWSHSKNVGMYKVDPATGRPTRFTGAVGPKNTDLTAGQKEKLGDTYTVIEGIQTGKDLVNAIPDNTRTSLTTGILPGALAATGRGGMAAVQAARSQEINKAYQFVSELAGGIRAGRFGLTLTPAELADSVQYLPSMFDDKERLAWKLNGLETIIKKKYENMAKFNERPGMPGLPQAPGGTDDTKGPYDDPEKNKRYNEFKRRQGQK